MDKAIVTAAITGAIHIPSLSPHLPITPRQIADEAIRAYEAGAAVAHIHVRDPETGQPSADVELYRETVERVKSKCDVVLCLTTGGGLGMPVSERAKVLSLRPELASLNFGSLNFGIFGMTGKIGSYKYAWEEPYLKMTEDLIFPNTFTTLREFSQLFAETNTKPEIEIYDVGMINNLAFMLQQGHLKKPVYLQFVLGILGGIPATPNNLMFLYNTAHEQIGDFIWSVCAAGRFQIRMCTMSLLMGGNARVGLEDSIYSEKGVLAKSNAEQVEKIVKIARELGVEPATPDEAREILNLKGIDKVNF